MKQRVVETFATRVKQRDLGPDLQVTYRAVGGMPSQRVDFTVTVDPVTGAKVVAFDARTTRGAKQSTVASDAFDVVSLFEQISAGLHTLRSASEAKFAPDALIGSITIRSGSSEETFYFVPEEDKRRRQEAMVAPAMEQALRRFWEVSKRTAEAQNGAKDE
jgi:hypothetical protein